MQCLIFIKNPLAKSTLQEKFPSMQDENDKCTEKFEIPTKDSSPKTNYLRNTHEGAQNGRQSCRFTGNEPSDPQEFLKYT